MTGYTLDIQIDNAGLQAISSANMSIAILEPHTTSTYQIVALLPPAANNLQIAWTDAQLVYSSSYPLQPYTVLHINSQATALPGQIFDFNGSMISQTGSSSLQDTVQLSNSSQKTVTAGLARTFIVDGTQKPPSILGAVSVLPNGLGSFQIENSIMLTLLSGVQEGMAIPTAVLPQQVKFAKRTTNAIVAAQPPLILNFSPRNAAQTTYFDDVNNVFVAGSLP